MQESEHQTISTNKLRKQESISLNATREKQDKSLDLASMMKKLPDSITDGRLDCQVIEIILWCIKGVVSCACDSLGLN